MYWCLLLIFQYTAIPRIIIVSLTPYFSPAVIIISGMEGEELARNCLEHGAAALMKKPFDDAVFKQLVTRLLEAAEGQIVQS